MTAKRCFRIHVSAEFKLANVLITLFFAALLLSLNIFAHKMHLFSLPLFTYPGVHLGILGVICFFVLAKPFKNKFSTPILTIGLFALYINMAYWGFSSQDFHTYNAANKTTTDLKVKIPWTQIIPKSPQPTLNLNIP